MAITSGIAASRVNKPSTMNRAQKNSAKTTKAAVMVEPIPKKEGMFLAVSVNPVSLSYPWLIIKTPNTILSNNMAVLNAPAE